MKARPAINELLKVLKEGGNHAAVAANALGNILDQDPQIPAILPNEPNHNKIIEILLNTLKHENFIVRLSVVEALSKIGKSAENKSKLLITENLIGLLNDSNLQVRQNAALTLGKIKEPADLIVPKVSAAFWRT
jgi:HEAT repeat protein